MSPRATLHPRRLYTPQIVALQTLLRLTRKDERITPDEKVMINMDVNRLTRILSLAQTK